MVGANDVGGFFESAWLIADTDFTLFLRV